MSLSKPRFVAPVQGNVVSIIDSRKKTIELPGVWPLIDENKKFINVIAVGNKNGLDKHIDLEKLRSWFPTAKIIFNVQSGPYLIRQQDELLTKFDGIMWLDFARNPKGLNMSHTMMVRSMPDNNFFWPVYNQKQWDFSILTNVGDHLAKRWDRCVETVDYLCSRGLTGILISQKRPFFQGYQGLGLLDTWRFFKIKRWIKKGQIQVFDYLNEQEFFNIYRQARVGVFPNQIDAFPKHIIEQILVGNQVVVSKDLLIGKSVLSDFGAVIDFDTDKGKQRCYQLIKRAKKSTPEARQKLRRQWLKDYGIKSLSKNWSKEINTHFGLKTKAVYFLNHRHRVSD